MKKAENVFFWILSVVAVLLAAMITFRVTMVYGFPEHPMAGAPQSASVR